MLVQRERFVTYRKGKNVFQMIRSGIALKLIRTISCLSTGKYSEKDPKLIALIIQTIESHFAKNS